MTFARKYSRPLNAGKAIGLRQLLRASLPVAILLFCAAFNFAYVNWVSPTWSYLGMTYKSPNLSLLLLGCTLALLSCTLSPKKIVRPSQVIYWFCFLAVYIPGLFVPLYLQLENGFELLLLQLSMTGGMLLIALSYGMPRFRIRSYPVDTRLFWFVFGVLYLAGNFAMVYTFRGRMHLASFNDVYSIRTPANQVLEANPGISYISQLLATVLNPLLMGYGLAFRRRSLFVLGTMGEVLLYSTAAVKLQIASPLVALLFYLSLKKDRGGWVPLVSLFFTGVFFTFTTLAIGVQPGPLFNMAFLVLVRMFTIPGAEMGQYQHFFRTMPHTYLAHIGVVNWFVPNPYELSMGQEVSSFYGFSGKYGLTNSNASFFATDGIGGFGLLGILAMGFLCGFVFWLLDSCARDYELKFSAPVLVMVTMSLTNVSLFTTLLGNGLIALMLLFLVMPRKMRTARVAAEHPFPLAAMPAWLVFHDVAVDGRAGDEIDFPFPHGEAASNFGRRASDQLNL